MNLAIAAEEMEKWQAYSISTAYENEKTIMMTIVYQDKLDSSKGAYWLIDKETNSSKLSYFDITDEEFELLGYPLYLTESNELIFIVDKDRYNNLKSKYPILLSEIDDFNSSYLLLKFHI